jgi:hypothetical protein
VAIVTVPTSPLPAELEWVELSLKLDATITVGAYSSSNEPTEWMKPGAAGKVHFSGMPDDHQIKAAYSYIQNNIIAPALEEVIVAINHRLGQGR